MSRDQRMRDNWALLEAQKQALAMRQPLVVVFCLADSFLGACLRQYDFMLRGLEQVRDDLSRKNIRFVLLRGDPVTELPEYLRLIKAGCLYTDFDPLKIKRSWKESVSRRIRVSFREVDAHNIVACWQASSKQEFGAYTLRPKLWRLVPEYWQTIPAVKKHPYALSGRIASWTCAETLRSLEIDRSVQPVSLWKPGEKAAQAAMRAFLKKKLARYADDRNDPIKDGQSGLSPYLHFGQLSAQRLAAEIREAAAPERSKEALLEELVVRRELADNFCFYNQDYDSFSGFPAWAQKTLSEHRRDRREYLYSLEQLDHGLTHDRLWNACQAQMRVSAKMHGYLRMYWAKKILEWSGSPEEALRRAIRLNDRYELDGRDPNGYAGIAWSIGGVHDRAWGERLVFGKIRYMSYNGCKSKFDVLSYIRRWEGASHGKD